MAAKRKRKTAKSQELDIVVSFPRELADLTPAQKKKLMELAEVFKARSVFSMDVPSDVMVKVEVR